MKKGLLFLLLVFCLLLAACSAEIADGGETGSSVASEGSSSPASEGISSPVASDKPMLDGLSMAFRSLDTSGETPRVIVEWTNNTGKDNLTFGETFSLSVKTEDGWEELPMKDDWGFISIGLLCTGTQAHTYDLGAYLDTLTPGAWYRIEACAIDEYPVMYYFSTTFRAE